MFVVRFESGVAGVAYATIRAQLISGLAIFTRLFRSKEPHGLTWREMRIDTQILGRIIKIGFPAGFQMALTSFSNVFVQAYINEFGAACTAGWGIYARVDAFVTLFTQSMAMSMTTFVGQNAGARRPDRIHKGMREAMKISLTISGTIIATLYISAPFIASLFNKDAQVLYYAVLFLRLNTLFDPFNVLNQIHAGALRGVGDSRTPMLIMLGSFVLFRQIYLFAVSHLIHSVHFVAFGYPIGWIMCCTLMLLHVKRSGWEKKIQALKR